MQLWLATSSFWLLEWIMSLFARPKDYVELSFTWWKGSKEAWFLEWSSGELVVGELLHVHILVWEFFWRLVKFKEYLGLDLLREGEGVPSSSGLLCCRQTLCLFPSILRDLAFLFEARQTSRPQIIIKEGGRAASFLVHVTLFPMLDPPKVFGMVDHSRGTGWLVHFVITLIIYFV